MGYPVFALGDKWEPTDANAVGLWLVKTQTVGTGVASTVVSGAFSSNYDNYLVTWQGGTMSGDTALKCQLGSTVTGYYGSYNYALYTATTMVAAGDNNATSFTYAGGGNASGAVASFNLYGPNKATRTYIDASDIGYGTQFGRYSGIEISTTQHTAFTLIPFSGTMTGGTIRVYGYRN